MFDKKKYLVRLLLVLILLISSLAFGFLVKKLQARTAEAKKTEQPKEKNKDKKEKQPGQQETAADSQPAENLTSAQPLPNSNQNSDSQNKKGDENLLSSDQPTPNASSYSLHKNITTTYFWAGEEAGADNKNISNLPSAWDEQWVKHFGGVDDPDKRNGIFPAKFTPKENPFYFALPYNDFDGNGVRKKEVSSLIPWAGSKKWEKLESMCKNQWIKITKGGKTAYAQWQDVGPFKEDDGAYVFGTALPKSKINKNAGLDVSPAIKDYLGLSDIDKTDWQFVEAKSVPNGPWKQVITASQIFWL